MAVPCFGGLFVPGNFISWFMILPGAVRLFIFSRQGTAYLGHP